MSERSSSSIDAPAAVRQGEELALDRLAEWLAGALGGTSGPLLVEQFRRGHSNLTYLLRLGEQELVLRRPPFGRAIRTAHDMAREFRVLSCLAPHYRLAPRPLRLCDDETVIGAPFYLMERVRGVILRGSRPAVGRALDGPLMRRLSSSLVETLAELHALDVGAVGLEDLGKPAGYASRQVAGWTERYERARTDEIAEVELVARWLAAQVPPDGGAAVIHNDFKYDNLVLAPDDLSRIVAVLDWEMATYGDPLMDLGTSLGYWIEPSDGDEMRALPLGPTLLAGNLSRRELIDRYAEASGRAVGHRVFYYAYGLFKIAVIAQQIYRRFRDGHSSDPRFAAMIMGVRILGRQAARAIERDRIDELG